MSGTNKIRAFDFIGFFAGQNTPFVPHLSRLLSRLSRSVPLRDKIAEVSEKKAKRAGQKWDKNGTRSLLSRSPGSLGAGAEETEQTIGTSRSIFSEDENGTV